jgi:NAD(P)-dependent dehydrogenase (short-subunit alcohol dehydrogenase family)
VEQSTRPVALVTGGSRGIGAATARSLAERGYDVAITYRNKAARAEEVAAQVAKHGGRALALAGDMTRQADVTALGASLGEWTPRLDALVLNASGGLEREALAADPEYPMRINRDAQLALLEIVLPLMIHGGVVVFVTSHWAHLYGQVEQLPAYGAVAQSKHAGEMAIRERQAALAAVGIRLIVVTGDLIEGTITPKLLERKAPGLAGQRRGEMGALPTATEMGKAIAAAATDASLPSGQTVVIGGPLESLPRITRTAARM